MTLILHSATPAFGARSGSPFATKAESLCRLAGAKFTRVDARPDQGPRGKLPFMTLTGGEVVSDSANILQHLEGQGFAISRSAHDVLVRRLVEEHLYFAILRFRWTYQLAAVEDAFFSELPWPLRPLVVRRVKKQVKAALHGQGIGRRPESETLKVVREDLEAVRGALGDHRYLGGESLSLADVSVHAILDQVINTSLDDPLITTVRGDDGLRHYHHRVDDAIYGKGDL